MTTASPFFRRHCECWGCSVLSEGVRTRVLGAGRPETDFSAPQASEVIARQRD
jgi:hypothetical protein